jgi:hypothetical protein
MSHTAHIRRTVCHRMESKGDNVVPTSNGVLVYISTQFGKLLILFACTSHEVVSDFSTSLSNDAAIRQSTDPHGKRCDSVPVACLLLPFELLLVVNCLHIVKQYCIPSDEGTYSFAWKISFSFVD